MEMAIAPLTIVGTGIGLNQVPGATTAKKSKDAALAATTAVLQQKEAMEGRINRLPVCIQVGGG